MNATPLAARPVRHANALALVVFTALALLAGALFSALGQQATEYAPQAAHVAQVAPAVVAAPVVHQDVATDEQTLMAALIGQGVGYTDEQAETFTLAADRVCEGITAQAPMVDMADHLVDELGLTDTEARHFVTAAAQTHC